MDETNISLFPEENNPAPLSKKELSDRYMEIYQKKGLDAANEFLETQKRLKTEQSGTVNPNGHQEEAANERPKWARHIDRSALPHSDTSIGAVPDITSSSEELSKSIEQTILNSPVDKSKLPAIKPRSISDVINILQPKSVAFGRYALSEWQENIMTLILEQLQGYMSSNLNAVTPDLFGELSVRLDCSTFTDIENKQKVIQEIDKMMNYRFEFWWQSNLTPTGTKKVETKGFIISTMHNFVGTSYVDVVINKWAFPFLLYYGKGIGGNIYQKRIALIIPGKYGKRLYKILSGYVDKGSFDYKIDALRKDWIIPESYTNGTIRRSIIDPAVTAINAAKPGFFVTAEFVVSTHDEGGGTDRTGAKKKQAFDTIRFTIDKLEEPDVQQPGISESQMEMEVVSALGLIVEEPYKANLYNIARTWKNHGDLRFVYSKITYYTEQTKAGNMTTKKMKNFLLKAIEEETGTKLRTTRKNRIRQE